MPKVTIWIRVKDLDKWQAIADKPEFIHNALNQPEFSEDPLTEAVAKGIMNAGDTSVGWTGPIPKSVSARKKK